MTTKDKKSQKPLISCYGRKGNIITIILIISFAFNILALLTPFTTMSSLFSKTIYCSLPYSVYLMWLESFYAIAILIFLFSIIFPFIKLFFLGYVWLIETNIKRRHIILRIIEPLGKWSMLDVFATCIILILCNKQILIYGSPRIGVIFFLAAIFLSISASIIIDYCHDKNPQISSTEKGEESSTNSHLSSFAYKLSAVVALTISIIVLAFAIFYPYLQISSFLLFGYSYSIFTSVTSLAEISTTLAVFLLLTMIIFPFLHAVFMLFDWLSKLLTNKTHPALTRLIKIFSRFNMLDVFVLAFVIFIIEGKSKIKIEHKTGLFLIAFFILLILIIPQIIFVIKRILRLKNER